MAVPVPVRCLVSLSIVFMLSEGVMAVTYSSRLIHRFSEEGKALGASRNGGVSGSWPERKSLEYYRMLVSSDVQRQKMKLGHQYQLLFPSEGSKTLPLGNAFGWLHYTWIDIGTPKVSFLVALDAGSDLLWVPCDCIQCAPLSNSYYTTLDRDLSEYSPSGSSTSKHLSCSHQLCELGPNCKSPNESCPYIVRYTSKDTTTSGLLVEDTLHLASGGDIESNKSVKAPVIIGCGREQTGGYLDGIAPDGLLGLGFGEISVPSYLAKSGLVRNSFSLCFNEDDSGRIFFGDQGLATQQSTAFLPLNGKYSHYFVGVEACCIGRSCLENTSFKTQVDSGSSFSFLPKEAYERVVKEFDSRVNATRTSFEGSPWQYCYKSSSQEPPPKIPSLTLKFQLNNSFVVLNPAYSTYDKGDYAFCLAIQPVDGDMGTIGQNYITGYRMVFDRENLKLGWTRSSCQDLSSDGKRMPLTPPPPDGGLNPLPTTQQQQSNPPGGGGGGRAVAPAVAGRTPSSKPAAASKTILISPSSTFCSTLFLLLFLHRL